MHSHSIRALSEDGGEGLTPLIVVIIVLSTLIISAIVIWSCRVQPADKPETDAAADAPCASDNYAQLSPIGGQGAAAFTNQAPVQEASAPPATSHPQQQQPIARGLEGDTPFWFLSSGQSWQSNESDHRDSLYDDPAILSMWVPFEEIKMGSRISHGAFGEVFDGHWRHEHVAIKRLHRHLCNDKSRIHAFLEEAKVCVQLCHPHIVRLIGVSWNDVGDVAVLTEFMAGGDLRALLDGYASANVPTGFDHPEKIQIALQVVLALQYLHLSRVIHRDLNSRNILLSETHEAKLTDFGIAREWVDDGVTAGVGTSRWIAPEVMQGGFYDEKADMYSFGAVMAELDNYLIPYGHVDRTSDGKKMMEIMLIQRIMSGDVSIRFSPCESKRPEIIAVYNMATVCTSLDPKMRPTASEAIRVLERASKMRCS